MVNFVENFWPVHASLYCSHVTLTSCRLTPIPCLSPHIAQFGVGIDIPVLRISTKCFQMLQNFAKYQHLEKTKLNLYKINPLIPASANFSRSNSPKSSLCPAPVLHTCEWSHRISHPLWLLLELVPPKFSNHLFFWLGIFYCKCFLVLESSQPPQEPRTPLVPLVETSDPFVVTPHLVHLEVPDWESLLGRCC